MQQSNEDESVFDRDVDVDLRDADRDARSDYGRYECEQKEVAIERVRRKSVGGVEAGRGAQRYDQPDENTDKTGRRGDGLMGRRQEPFSLRVSQSPYLRIFSRVLS